MKKLFTMLFAIVASICNVSAFAADNGLASELSAPTVVVPPLLQKQSTLDMDFGVGLVALQSNSLPITSNETYYIQAYGASRQEATSRLAKNIVFSFRFDNVPTGFELSYTFDDPGAHAETSGTAIVYNYNTGLPMYAPLSVKHSEKYSAINFSAVGEHKLNDAVSLIGKFGYTRSSVVSETRTAYSCAPACAEYVGESTTVNSTSITYGVGINAKVATRPGGPVVARFVVENVNGFNVPRLDLLFPL